MLLFIGANKVKPEGQVRLAEAGSVVSGIIFIRVVRFRPWHYE